MTDEEKKHVIAFVIEYEMYTDVPASAVSASDEVIAYFNPDDPSSVITGDDVTGDNTTGDDVTGDDSSNDTTGDDITGDDTTGDDS
mgnify:CR=1 FL=1